jgi:hypothetical protein
MPNSEKVYFLESYSPRQGYIFRNPGPYYLSVGIGKL